MDRKRTPALVRGLLVTFLVILIIPCVQLLPRLHVDDWGAAASLVLGLGLIFAALIAAFRTR